jgi:uncharacterized protein (DUF302 family)
MTSEGLVTFPSPRPPPETLARARAEIAARKLTIFAEIDHAAGAEAVGLTLRPLFLIIFGAARGGTPLMQAAPTAGIDLPLKLLVWQDGAGETQVSYNDPDWVAKRHGLGEATEAPVRAMSAMLRSLTDAVVA